VAARLSAPVQTVSEAHPASYTRGTGSLPGVKRPGRVDDHPPHLTPRLKKEWSYTSTHPLGLRGLFYGEIYFTLTFTSHLTKQTILLALSAAAYKDQYAVCGETHKYSCTSYSDMSKEFYRYVV
jgi:hypothetical protein